MSYKKYYDAYNNTPERKLYMREYMRHKIENAQYFHCECGSKYLEYNKSQHLKTNKHTSFLINRINERNRSSQVNDGKS